MGAFWESSSNRSYGKKGELYYMRKKNYKGRVIKRYLPKCNEVCRTYDPLMSAYAEKLSKQEDIEEFRCNVFLEGLSEGDYTTDFLIKKTDGTLMVRECVYRSRIIKPLHYKMLELSRKYWLHRGIVDWGCVINEQK